MPRQDRTVRKREAFRRLAEQRTIAVLQRLRILGNCANRQLYDFDDAEVRKIFRAIEAEVKATKAKFLKSGEKDFTL
jgi:hypothetical protein